MSEKVIMSHEEMHKAGIEHVHEHLNATNEEFGNGGHVHIHGSEHSDGHKHIHSHTQTKAVLNRMSKIIGHMEHVKSMVEDGRDCSEVLVQLAAVKSAIASVSKVILKDHIDHCMVDAVMENDMQTIEELKNAIDKFL